MNTTPPIVGVPRLPACEVLMSRIGWAARRRVNARIANGVPNRVSTNATMTALMLPPRFARRPPEAPPDCTHDSADVPAPGALPGEPQRPLADARSLTRLRAQGIRDRPGAVPRTLHQYYIAGA